MDGENNGKPYEQMDDLGGVPYFWKPPYEKLQIHSEHIMITATATVDRKNPAITTCYL